MSSAPTPVPASHPLPPLGGPLTPFPAPAEPRNDDEVAEQWSRGMAMLHDESLAQVIIVMLSLTELNAASFGRLRSFVTVRISSEHKINVSCVCRKQW